MVGNFTNGFSGPKSFRDFRETGPRAEIERRSRNRSRKHRDGGTYLYWGGGGGGGGNKQGPETLNFRGFWGNPPPENLKS